MQYSSVSVDNKIPFQRVSFKMTAPILLPKGRICRLQVDTDGTVTIVTHAVDGDSASATNPAALYGVVDKDVALGAQALIIVSGIVEVNFYGKDSDYGNTAIAAGDSICANETYGASRLESYGALAKAGDIVLGVVLGEIGVDKVASNSLGRANVLFNGIDKFPQR